MVKKKGKPDYLHLFVTYVGQMLVDFNTKLSAGQQVDWRMKEALIFAIGTIKDEIQDAKDIESQMENMLQTYIL